MASEGETGTDPRAQALVASYARAGYARIDPPVLQPAEPFLDLSGEDIRRRMFLTADPDGRELCLRPDLTIPVSRDYLASPSRKARGLLLSRRRLPPPPRRARPNFFRPASKASAAPTRRLRMPKCWRSGWRPTTQYGVDAPEVRIGDVGLFSAFVAALDLAPVWKRRLIKDFNRKSSLKHDLDQLTLAASNGSKDYQGVLAALNGSDPKAAHALVTDLLSIAGIATVGGRSVAEIADRFLEQSALNAPTRLPRDTRALIERFLSIAGDPDDAAGELRALAADAKIALEPALDLFETRTGFLAARGVDVRAITFATDFGRGIDYYTGFVFELHGARGERPLVAGGRYDGLLTRLGAREAIPAVGFAASIDELAEQRRRAMSAPLILAVPSKGRLQENAESFFGKAGLELVKPRGARDYRGTIAGVDGVEIAYLSAAEITAQLAQGAVQLGITGEDLVREMIPQSDRRVVLITGLGFGFANVVVAVPQAWIDVRNMADLDDVATAFRLKHERKMRLATKYANLTRDFFAAHGVVDYRIVESSGATEGAPAAGTAEMIVDITTTGATLAANGLKVIEDGIILRSQANLVAARAAAWSNEQRETARLILDRIAAQKRAEAFAEVRTRFAGLNEKLLTVARGKIRHRLPVRRPDLVRHADVALPAAQRACAGEFPA